MRRATLEDVYLELVDEQRLVRVFAHQLRSEQLIFWRNRESAGFIFVFPLMLFLLLGSLYGDETTDEGYPAIEMLLAGMLGYGAANTGFAGMAITLVIRREYGILKRIRSTPLPACSYFAAALDLDPPRFRAPGRSC